MIICIAALIVATSAFYYFAIFLPDQTRREAQLSMKQKCQTVGMKLYEKDVQKLGEYKVCNPEFSYNTTLNTCLYFGCSIEKDSDLKWIRDVFTNKEILWFWRIGSTVVPNDKSCDICVSNEEFEKQKQELFQ